MRDAFESLLGTLPELICVCDPDTYEMLYVNEAGRQRCGKGAGGELPCYSELKRRGELDKFCPSNALNKDDFMEWEFRSPATGRHFMMRDKLIIWQGATARLEIAFDVTEHEMEKNEIRFLAESGSVAIECIKMMETCADLDGSLDGVMSAVGEFLEADRTYVFSIEGDLMYNTREWCAEGVEPQRDMLQDVPLSVIEPWFDPFDSDEAVTIQCVGDLPAQGRTAEYDILSVQNIDSLVVAPLKAEGQLIGYFGADNPKRGDLSESVKMPIMAVAYFLASRMSRESVQRKVEELTWRDPLTGAYTRAAFYRDLDQGVFRRLGFVLVDADGMADINQEEGREAGDDMLRRIFNVMHDVFGDFVYRVGDDEFCAAVGDVSYEEFALLAEHAHLRLDEDEVSASVGMAWSGSCSDTAALLDLAQQRMRVAKRGRHRAVKMGIDLVSDAAVSSLLRPGGAHEAVVSGRFAIYLMPQASMADLSLVGAESLIRYIDADHGTSAVPDSFIPALEDMGEIADVDFFALEESCRTIARWRDGGRTVVPLSVNFSRLTVDMPHFADRVEGIARKYNVSPSLIEVEVTESAREHDMLRAVMDDLRQRGFRAAIDDFGVENANFSLFMQFDFDVLKMDKSLVWGLGGQDRPMRVITGLANLCEELSIESVAEGVETKEQLDALRGAGCTRAQGFLIGRPAPIATFEREHLATLR